MSVLHTFKGDEEKQDHCPSQPPHSSPGSWWPRAQWGLTLDETPFHRRATHTPAHPDGDSADTLSLLTCTSVGCGRKPASPEETHADPGRMCQLLTDGGPGQKLMTFFFPWEALEAQSGPWLAVFGVWSSSFLKLLLSV